LVGASLLREIVGPKFPKIFGLWHAQRELTMLELHPDFTYDRYFADVIGHQRVETSMSCTDTVRPAPESFNPQPPA
jgi:hypothetical protein